MSFLNMARNAGLGFKKQSRYGLNQLSKATGHNADLQAATISNADRSQNPTSLLANPAEVHEIEKYDLLDQMKDRAASTLRLLSEKTLIARLTPALAQFAAHGVTLVDAVKMIPGVSLEVATTLVKLGPIRTSGWKLTRLTEAWAVTAKMFTVQAEAAVRLEAPIVAQTGTVTSRESHLDVTTADMAAVLVKDEIHRVANAFALDANYLVALLKATATIHAMGKIELATLADLDLSAVQNIHTKAGVSTRQTSTISHTIAAGTSIKMSAGLIDLNPLVPETPDVPTVVVPVVTLDADGKPRKSEMVPQYSGMNGHGASVI